MALHSRGNPYGIDENLFFSFPCTTNEKGEVKIVPNLSIDSNPKKKSLLPKKS